MYKSRIFVEFFIFINDELFRSSPEIERIRMNWPSWKNTAKKFLVEKNCWLVFVVVVSLDFYKNPNLKWLNLIRKTRLKSNQEI